MRYRRHWKLSCDKVGSGTVYPSPPFGLASSWSPDVRRLTCSPRIYLGCLVACSSTLQALAAYLETEKEVCVKEARSVVAETMAPFEDQLVEMQREKDSAAIQVSSGE